MRTVRTSPYTMRCAVCILFLAVLMVLSGTRADSVQINFMSDPHYDPAYGTANAYGSCTTASSAEYGSAGCDSPYRLLTSTTSDMVAQASAFTIMAGDWQRHDMSAYSTSAQTVFRTLSILFSSLTRSGQMATPTFMGVLGNNDVMPDYYFDINSTSHPFLVDQTTYMRQFNLLTDAEKAQMQQCGFFSRQPTTTLRIIGLHTNVWLQKLEPAQPDSFADPCGQFAWMTTELAAARAAGQRVIVLGHVPPLADVFGVINRNTLTSVARDMYWKPLYQQTYTDLIRANSDIIAVQLFGHTHRFSIVADPLFGVPMYVLNAVTPLFGNTPSYMLTTFDNSSWTMTEMRQRTKTTVGTAPVWTTTQSVATAMGLTTLNDAAVMNTQIAKLASDDTLWNNYMLLRTGGILDDPCQTDFCRTFTVCAMRYSTFTALQTCVSGGTVPTTTPTTTTSTSTSTSTTTTTAAPTTTTSTTSTSTSTTTAAPSTTTSTTTTTSTSTAAPTTTTTTSTSSTSTTVTPTSTVVPTSDPTSTTVAPDVPPSLTRPQTNVSAAVASAALNAATPIFHVRPPNNWINDPNGAYRDPVTGRIHIYMQYNPYSALWGNMSWYHVTSDDYVHWYREDELAMINDKWYDDWGVYSGTMMNNNYSEPVAVYTCVETENIQRQCIANPSKEDLNGKRTLNTLHKSPLNVVMSEDDIPNLVKLENFRDPTEWWEDPANPGNWLIAFVARIDDEEGDNAHVIVFTTDDPSFQSNYKFSHSIYVYKYDLDHMFECPDFFVLSDPVNTGNSAAEHFLKVSTMPSHRDYVMYGSYEMNPATNQYDFVEDADRTFTFLDYGPLYAAKSFWDPILKKRFLWGWTNEDLSDAQILAQGWSGAQNVLRGLEYDATEKKLKSFPMDEVKGLRGEKVLWKTDLPVTSAPTTVLNNNNTLYHDIVVTFTVSDPSVFSATATYTADNAPEIGVMLRATDDLSEYVKIGLAMPAGSPATTAGQAQVEGRPPIKDFVGPTAANCSAECNNLRLCESWTYYTSTSNCKLYYLTNELAASTGASSGTVREPLLMMERANSGTIGGSYTLSGRAPFAQATPNSFELRILVDDSMIEAFKDGGLETLTGRVYIDNGLDHTGIALYANNLGTATVTADIQVFTMTSMWAERPTTAVRDFTDSLYTLLSKLIDV